MKAPVLPRDFCRDAELQLALVWFGCDVVAASLAAGHFADARHYLDSTKRALARAKRALRRKAVRS